MRGARPQPAGPHVTNREVCTVRNLHTFVYRPTLFILNFVYTNENINIPSASVNENHFAALRLPDDALSLLF